MAEKNDISAIAFSDNINILNAVGIKTNVIKDIKEADEIIFELSKSGTKIIYVSEEIYTQIPKTLEKYAHLAYPIILPLPFDGPSKGVGDKKIRASVEKAIGINIF